MLRRARVGCHGRIGLRRSRAGELVAEPVGETRDAWSIQQLDDRQNDAQVELNLSAQLHRGERVDPEVLEGQLSVQTRWCHTEFAGNFITQVRLVSADLTQVE